MVKARSLIKAEQAKRITSQNVILNHNPDLVLDRALGWSARLQFASKSGNVLDSLNFQLLRISNDSLDFWMHRFFSHLLAISDALVRPIYSEYQHNYWRAAKSVDSAKLIFNKVARDEKSPYLFP